MGSGSSANYKKVSDDTLNDKTSTHSGPLCNHLMEMMAKEKQEKEWLAKRYEEKCDEVRHLRKVLERRVDSSFASTAGSLTSNNSACGSAAGSRPASRGMQPAVLQKAQGDAVSVETQNGQPGPGKAAEGKGTVIKVPASKLTERRKLNLTVATNPERSPVQLGREATGQLPIPDPVKQESPVAARSPPSLSDGAKLPDEPMSALLRRRKEDWSVNQNKNAAGEGGETVAEVQMKKVMTINTMQPISESKPIQVVTQKSDALNVQASKLFSMDECPASPKRASRAGGF
eukprot:TRINITY_DN29050_c0_g1_i1.p1 TRINITY_DN29050_c0_g1~~TRINITY_DN29050_c0_g1_i1.p1  ORF type:complete len:288 (-),score=59.85 TRINITY_DN29050_c0_g1_i1:16-879(-)